MNARFIAAAIAIASHFKQAEARRGEPYPETFINPMNNDAVTPNSTGVPITLLRALVNSQNATDCEGVRCHGDACASGQKPCPTPTACGVEGGAT